MSLWDKDDLRKELAEILPKAQHNKIEKIVELFDDDTIREVETHNTHVAIEHVELYGLVIGVDGNGHAASVSFPHGAVVIA